jgi:hypothetical protein
MDLLDAPLISRCLSDIGPGVPALARSVQASSTGSEACEEDGSGRDAYLTETGLGEAGTVDNQVLILSRRAGKVVVRLVIGEVSIVARILSPARPRCGPRGRRRVASFRSAPP